MVASASVASVPACQAQRNYTQVYNIARICDLAQQGVFFDNAYADPTQSFKYDPTYRLTEATGR